jgi:hypothetical protein
VQNQIADWSSDIDGIAHRGVAQQEFINQDEVCNSVTLLHVIHKFTTYVLTQVCECSSSICEQVKQRAIPTSAQIGF